MIPFRSFISILVVVIALRLMAAPTYSAWATTAPWPFSTMAVPFAGSMRPARGNHTHQQVKWREVKYDCMAIDLTAREVPAKGQGLHRGVIADVVQETQSDKRKRTFRTLTLVGELEALKSNGKRFVALATYNLDDDRGNRRLIEDLKIWRNVTELPNLDQFDPEQEFLGKPFVSELTFHAEDRRKVIRLKGFRPDPDKKVKVSEGFVRAKDKPQAPVQAEKPAAA
jgi:hypothetical protein